MESNSNYLKSLQASLIETLKKGGEILRLAPPPVKQKPTSFLMFFINQVCNNNPCRKTTKKAAPRAAFLSDTYLKK
jgi:hypothetical protein